jgi:glycine hydroxymethyltransferase
MQHPLFELTQQEFLKQKNTLNLIASENLPSPKTLQLLGSVWSNKYGEGYPTKRYYAGNMYTDELESFVQQKALQVFDTTSGEYGVNVQVLSGSPANAMVYFSVLKPGDTIMSMRLSDGGHLSHLHATSSYNNFYNHVTYDIGEAEKGLYEVNLDSYTQTLIEHKPKLVIIGYSSYPRAYDCEKLISIAHEHGALVLADIAHINGIVAAKLHSSPFGVGAKGADFVSMTTHKTLRGPRGAMLFAKNEHIDSINKTIFPGTSGGPHFHQMAAIGQSLLEVLGEDAYPDSIPFITYTEHVLDTCSRLETQLIMHGFEAISPTQTHMCLIKLPESSDSLEVQKNLEKAGIITNRNVLPFDPKTPWKPSGLRLGTSTLASRGITLEQIDTLAELIANTVFSRRELDSISSRSYELAQSLQWWYESV